VSDGEIQRCQERCQKETPEIHSGKKEGQTSEKGKITERLYEVLHVLEKWNRILPQYIGSGSIPFIQIK
jgi:hypothetical protein